MISTTWTFALTIITFMLIIEQYHSVTEAAAQQQQRNPNTHQRNYQHGNQWQPQPQQQQQWQPQPQQWQPQQQQQWQPQQQQWQPQHQQQQPQLQGPQMELPNRSGRIINKSSTINRDIEYDNDVEEKGVGFSNANRKLSHGIGNPVQNYQQPTARKLETICKIWVPVDALSKYPLARRGEKQMANTLQLIDYCCEGYAGEEYLGNYICRPICEGCQNGLCKEPGVCECYDEYVMNDNGECVFSCPMGCLNGRCYLDGSCKCDIGYKLDESRKFCRPICSMGCGENPGHNCTEPEVCSCAQGYTLTDGGCKPVCEPDCGDGGICQDKNQCHCLPGYELKDGTCQATCYQKCVNGYCIAQNRCICKPGYTYHEKTTFCTPI